MKLLVEKLKTDVAVGNKGTLFIPAARESSLEFEVKSFFCELFIDVIVEPI